MLNRVGATQWTIGRLMTIVLLIVVLALVMYGVSTGGLNPLIERAGGMFDSIQILFGFKDGGSVDGDCGKPYPVEIEGVGRGMVTLCRGSCGIELEEELSFGKEFNWTEGSLFVRGDSKWNEIFDIIDNLPLAVKEKEVNKILMKDFESYANSLEGSFFMGSGIVPIHFLVKGDWGKKKYFKWENGAWFEEKDNKWGEENWKNDFEGLKEIYSESNDGWFNPDDEVFYRIGKEGMIMRYRYFIGSEDVVSFEDIRVGEDSYELFDIFNGDPGEINDDGDFKIFQNWFFLEKEKIIENQRVLDDGLSKVEELLPSESLGDFDGELYYLFLTRDSDGEGVFYLETSVEKYGLKGEDLRLVKDCGKDGWKFAESLSALVGTDGEFEERVKLYKIRKFLEERC